MQNRIIAIATQCTAPNGAQGCFLWQAGNDGRARELGHKFIGPRDNQKLLSPIFQSLVELSDWDKAQKIFVLDWRTMSASFAVQS